MVLLLQSEHSQNVLNLVVTKGTADKQTPAWCLVRRDFGWWSVTVPPPPVRRGQDPLPGGSGSPEVHAGNPGEAQVLPGPLRNHGAAASRAARVHEGGLPGAGGRDTCCAFDFHFFIVPG